MTLNIALLQLSAGTDPVPALREAAALRADIALFPEMWHNGYSLPHKHHESGAAAMRAQAIPSDGPYVNRFRALAAELNMAIAITYLQAWDPLPRSVVTLIDRHGRDLFTYAKVHTCDFDAECWLTPGDAFQVGALDTRHGPVQVGAMICYDREFPEAARVLMLKGAEVVLVPNACEMEINRLTQLRARAYENMAAVCLANYAAPDANGHSVAYDGVAFAAPDVPGEDGSSRDMLLVEAGESAGVVMARLDLGLLRDYRQRESWGDAYRKPSAYGPLLTAPVRPVFQRPDSRRD